MGAATAVAFPPSILESKGQPVPDTVDFSLKKPGQGNYMPSDPSYTRVTRTSPAAPGAAAVEITRRATGEKVSNGAVARFDNNNIKDGVGSGTDTYTLHLGSGSTSDGWPDKSKWVSFEDMYVCSFTID